MIRLIKAIWKDLFKMNGKQGTFIIKPMVENTANLASNVEVPDEKMMDSPRVENMF